MRAVHCLLVTICDRFASSQQPGFEFLPQQPGDEQVTNGPTNGPGTGCTAL
jgi:hypothetical protein